MRGLRGTAEVVRIVVTIGLMLAMLTIAPVIWPEDEARNVDSFFAGSKIDLFGVGISYHRITTLVVALLVALFLRIILFQTRLGTAMRAVVDDPSLARLNGIRPDTVSMVSWALGSALAALSGVLIASQSALNATTLTLLVVNAFAAAVFGRLTSLPRAFVGAVVLGLAEALTVGFIKAGTGNALERAITDFEKSGWTITNLQPAMPAIVLFIVMWFTNDTRSRSHSLTVSRERFNVPTWRLAIFGGVALIVVTAMFGSLIVGPRPAERRERIPAGHRGAQPRAAHGLFGTDLFGPDDVLRNRCGDDESRRTRKHPGRCHSGSGDIGRGGHAHRVAGVTTQRHLSGAANGRLRHLGHLPGVQAAER
jgi:branched-chain amino acid transport system permease protein